MLRDPGQTVPFEDPFGSTSNPVSNLRPIHATTICATRPELFARIYPLDHRIARAEYREIERCAQRQTWMEAGGDEGVVEVGGEGRSW